MSLRIKAVVDKFVQELKEALDADIQDRIMKEREMQSYIEEREREVAEREAAWKAELSRREFCCSPVLSQPLLSTFIWKGNQQNNGLDRQSPTHKKGLSDPPASPLTTKDRDHVNDKEVDLGKDLPNDSHSMSSTKSISDMDHVQDGKKSKKKSRKSQRKERKSMDETVKANVVPCNGDTEVLKSNISTAEASNIEDRSNLPHVPILNNMNNFGNLSHTPDREEGLEKAEFPETVVFKYLRTAAFSLARSSADWVVRHKPTFVALKSKTLKARDHVRMKIQYAQPIIFRWIVHIGNILLLLFMVWLDCALRGIDSFLRMGTTSFFSVVWCSVLSVIAMVGIAKFVLALAVAAAVGLFLGLTLAVVLTGIVGLIFLWFYGSFWTTGFIIFLGGLAFTTTHDRLALFITIHYSPSDTGATGTRADRSAGVPSTSGSDFETTSEDEVVRLLNCADHYAALGLSRFENIDVSVIKKEYRKKAMLVHPDKNMGNEKAAEAFKKLQNAYEVLLDSFKRKEYDDELRREELLNYFRKFQNTSHENKGHGFFKSSFARTEADSEDLLGESRRIACRKCGYFHLWVYTKKSKSRARWCQECKDFHQAKDGDGWVEQSSQPFLFGLLQQVGAPSAYVCADGKVYNATEWYICQGMRCPINTHKPTFHVNASVVSKNGNGKATNSGQRGGIPAPKMEETMTEEEFLEWLQNAVQNGMFETFPGKIEVHEQLTVVTAAKKEDKNISKKKKGDSHSFVAKPDEATGPFPEAVLLKERKVEEDGRLMPDFADVEERELFEALNLQLESDMDLDRMRHYEVVYLIHEDYKRRLRKSTTKFKHEATGHSNSFVSFFHLLNFYIEFLREKKGKIWRFSDWGMRRLAYKIQKAKNAHYILMNFELEAKWINDFKSILDKDERVIRHLVMKRDKAETEDCPPPPDFHSLRADMNDDGKEDDIDSDEEYDDEEWDDDGHAYEDDEGIIYVDDDAGDIEMSDNFGRNKQKAEKVGR
ncbi:UNVERIFIED_CONTAM: 30S ribosomal protein S6 [Sesamum radiatum]|uniref:30S ribosomal protein S6 n=2 Tax=Lamiales TaxID=4143 RepID=A0AAW2UCK0_SESRA